MQVSTVSELIFWSYANLAMAQNAVKRGIDKYDKTSYMIRLRLYKGLTTGKMQIHSLFDDEKFKVINGAKCIYCGSVENLSIDHIFPRAQGGSDDSDNLVCSCKNCNSSKGKMDLMGWHTQKGEFPSLMVLRRYLKLVFQFCANNQILDNLIEEVDDERFPFKLSFIPTKYPKPEELRLL